MPLDRLVVLLVVVALTVAAVVLVRAWIGRRRRRLLESPTADLWQALGVTPDDRPTLVAFSSPSCAACHTAQAPALRQLQAQVGERGVRLLEVDVADRPDAARAFGIMTVPSTVLLNRDAVFKVNHGFQPTRRLAEQLAVAARGVDPSCRPGRLGAPVPRG
jgi:thioredoxin-like negative regulator of GroEL